MNDLKNFKHGEEGTHGACQEMINKFGSKTKCCECSGHKCKQEKAEEKCTDATHDIQIDYCGYCVRCANKPKAETKEIKDITFDLVEMIMRMATSKKKKETFYVSKVAEKLDKLIAKEMERQRRELIEEIYNFGEQGDYYDPRKCMNYLERLMQAIKEEQPEEI